MRFARFIRPPINRTDTTMSGIRAGSVTRGDKRMTGRANEPQGSVSSCRRNDCQRGRGPRCGSAAVVRGAGLIPRQRPIPQPASRLPRSNCFGRRRPSTRTIRVWVCIRPSRCAPARSMCSTTRSGPLLLWRMRWSALCATAVANMNRRFSSSFQAGP